MYFLTVLMAGSLRSVLGLRSGSGEGSVLGWKIEAFCHVLTCPCSPAHSPTFMISSNSNYLLKVSSQILSHWGLRIQCISLGHGVGHKHFIQNNIWNYERLIWTHHRGLDSMFLKLFPEPQYMFLLGNKVVKMKLVNMRF